ncbi:MAG: hypothetical protein QXN17_05180, partial [Nitrososphaerota archaeon]
PVDQWEIARLARGRSRVQIPPGPINSSNLFFSNTVSFYCTFSIYNIFLDYDFTSWRSFSGLKVDVVRRILEVVGLRLLR